MQFKHPELFWALLALLIPIFIHLFQLRRFKKTPFTNVRFLQRVISESRKSSVLKKWLLLITRLFLLAALIFAFTEPFFMGENALKEKETVIYLDDSFSLQAKSVTGTLLESAVQELLKTVPEDQKISLFTNTKVFRDVTIQEIQNDLLTLTYTPDQLSLSEIYLKSNTLFNQNKATLKRLVLMSDFQSRILSPSLDSTPLVKKYAIQLLPTENSNTAIDSVYVEKTGATNMELKVLLSGNQKDEIVPVSLFNGEKLIAKNAAVFDSNKKATVDFTLPENEIINGKVTISDAGITYDNQLFFNINAPEKIKVLVLGDEDTGFLERIFTDDEFALVLFTPNTLNYAQIASQNLIILNELPSISLPLANALKDFHANGGCVVIIPNKASDANAYNLLLANLNSGRFDEKITAELKISTIAFSHPLYVPVFEKKVTNFEYPKIFGYYRLKNTAPQALTLENNDPFLTGGNQVYVFSASISKNNSNFQDSPLIVPTFYNIGNQSLQLPALYERIGQTISLDVSASLLKDEILSISGENMEFIPLQQSFPNKVQITLMEYPEQDGIYTIENGEEPLKNVSFNYSREESALTYASVNSLDMELASNSVASIFQELEKEDRIIQLWKWFVILALLFLMIEILIQKIMK